MDSESFNPVFRSQEMRVRLTYDFYFRPLDHVMVLPIFSFSEFDACFCCVNSNGEPERPLIVHVGRLGVEKSLDFLKRCRLLFLGH